MSYSLFEHYQIMEEQNIVLSFKGEISNKTLVSLAEMLKKLFSFGDKKERITKRLFSIFIEFSQNIALYSARRVSIDGKEVGTGIIVIERNKGFYRVNSGNLIENSALDPLVSKIRHINKLDKAGLKKFYNECLKSPRETGKKGGGIGLIVIARKSESPINIKLNPSGKALTFIELSTKIMEE